VLAFADQAQERPWLAFASAVQMQVQAFAVPIAYEQEHVQAYSLPNSPTGGAPQSLAAQPVTFVQQSQVQQDEDDFVNTPPSPTTAQEVLQPLSPQGMSPQALTAPAPYQQQQQMQYSTRLTQAPYPSQVPYPTTGMASYSQQVLLQPAPMTQPQPYGQDPWAGDVQIMHMWQPDELSQVNIGGHAQGSPEEMPPMAVQLVAPWETGAPGYRIANASGALPITSMELHPAEAYSGFTYMDIGDESTPGRMSHRPRQHLSDQRGHLLSARSPAKGGQSFSPGGAGAWLPGKGQDGPEWLFGQRKGFDHGYYGKGRFSRTGGF
jgi:hypothetical protein